MAEFYGGGFELRNNTFLVTLVTTLSKEDTIYLVD
jgi:hypothetical protein